MRSSTLPKKQRSFSISPEVFIKLKIFSAKKGIPYSVIIEALVDSYINDPVAFPVIDFNKYI